MSTNKILIGGIAGGIAFFFLSWLFYGALFMGFMADNLGTATGIQKEPVILGGLILANFAWGFLFSFLFSRHATPVSPASGAWLGAVIGLLTSIYYDLCMYSTSNIANLKSTLVDILIMVIISAIGGAFIAFIMGTGKKPNI